MWFVRRLLEQWKHARLRAYRQQVEVDPSARLLRHFGVRFLVPPQPRLYLRVGERCLLNARVTFESTGGLVEIGARTYIGNDCQLISRQHISIGSDVTMAWGITLYDHNSHSLDWRTRQRAVDHFYRSYGLPGCFEQIDWAEVSAGPIVIGDRVWIGFGAVVLKGVTVGEGAVIGACSVVSRDVEPYTVVAGNPAVLVRRIERTAPESSPHANP